MYADIKARLASLIFLKGKIMDAVFEIHKNCVFQAQHSAFLNTSKGFFVIE